MEASDEIREAMLEMVRGITEDAELFPHLWSSRDGVVSVGSDPREWSDGLNAIVALNNARTQAHGRLSFRIEHLVALQEGSVGWGVMQGMLEWRDRVFELPWRLTGVFHLERGKWKLCHSHRSFGVPDETVGFNLTAVLEDVAQAVDRERPNLSKATAPNGTVTILFTDIEGSTKLTEHLGDPAWMKLLRQHNQVIREQAAIHAGFEVKSQGDGFMLAFASARDALRCAVGIQKSLASASWTSGTLRVRIGLHSGEAIREKDDFFGKAVILAARIAAEARGSEILVSSLVRELVESSAEFSLEGPHQVELNGLVGVHNLFAVAWRKKD